jgi:glycosyltransferase involved in cell wall biosynthesis
LKIIYLLNSFPNISETFISDEIYSLLKQGVCIEIYSLHNPEQLFVHDNAQKIIDQGCVHYLSEPTKTDKLKGLLYVLLKKPLRAFKLIKSSFPTWLFLEAISYKNIIKPSKFDFFHCHFADKSAQIAYVFNQLDHSQFSITTHGYDIFFQPPDNYFDLGVAAENIFAISNFNANYLHQTFLIPKDKIQTQYCGIDLSHFDRIKTSVRSINEPIKILTVARLHPVKGHSFLLDAIKKFKNENDVDFQLIWAGDGAEKAALENKVALLDLKEHVLFLGAQSQEEVRELIYNCDLFLLTSLSEGLPICLMEAMAGYLPVIAPNLNGIPELIDDRKSGLLFERLNVNSLLDALTFYLNNTEVVNDMIAQARQKIEHSFSINSNVKTKFKL